MAQSGYTPILIYASGTTGNAPVAANLTSSSSGAELALNYFDGKLFYKDASGNVQVLAVKMPSGILPIANGGTNATATPTAGAVAYGTGTAYAFTSAGTPGYLLTSNGSSAPLWISTLPVANGGTNATATPTAGAVAYGTGTAYAFTAAGTSNQVLVSNGASAPTWSDLSSIGVTTFSAGTTGFTPSSATAGAVTLAGTLATTNGGTGLTSFSANQVFYASSTSAVAQSSNLQFSGTDLTVYGITVGRGAGAVSTNTVVGNTALAVNTTGSRNTAVGYFASLYATGSSNTAVGISALTGSSGTATGSANTAIGDAALTGNTSGSYNTAIGTNALNANSSASYNTAVGYQAAYNNQTGGITAVGYQAGFAAVSASNVTYIGNSAGLYATGNTNTAVGVAAMLGAAGVSTGAGNTALGYAALYSNRDGVRNTSVGLSSLENNTSGNYNTAVGYQAIASNTSTSNSTAVGYQAGLYQSGGRNTSIGVGAGAGTSSSNTTSQSTFIGFNAGANIQGGSYLVLIGDSAGASNTTGSYNVAIGQNALVTNQSGGSNIAIGGFALNSNLASSNVAIGYQAAFNTTTDTQVIAIGYNALFENTTGGGGSYNIAIGQSAHYYGQTGSYYNIAIGASAHRGTSNGTQTGKFNTAIGNPITPLTTGSYVLGEITSGSQNVALGNGVLGNLTSGNNNTAAGFAAMQKNSTGSNNTAIGRDALSNNTNASGNTAIGYTALYQNQTGVNNTALGNAALYYTGGDSNIGIGVSAGQSCTGTANIAIGSGITGVLNSALSNQTGGSYNVAIGSGSLSQVAAAYSYNTAVGHNALFTASGSTNTAIGFGAGAAITTGSKNTILGSFSGNQSGLNIITASNYIVLSDGDGNPRGYYNSAASVWNLGGGRTVIGPAFIADNAASGNNIGFAFGGASIFPCDGSGNLTNQTTNLGDSSYRYAVAHVTGVNFPATQVASANANTLDDYEEGTFTATLKGGTTDPTTPVTTTGYYTKIGNLVNVVIQFSNVTTTGAAGEAYATGLPFTSSASSSEIGSIMCYQFDFNGLTSASCYVGAGTTNLFPYMSGSNSAWNGLLHNAGTGRYLWMSVTYRAA